MRASRKNNPSSTLTTTMTRFFMLPLVLLASRSLIVSSYLLSPASQKTSSRGTVPILGNKASSQQWRSSFDKTLRHQSSTALNVWWFGGTESSERVGQDEDSCELVAVRIERPSANSRRIFGEIVAPVPIDDVWAILTDYDRLSVHVPNLVESKVMKRGNGEQGDGNFQCRLFQKGAQKIVGFDFSASVTMEMKESIKRVTTTARSKGAVGGVAEERRIYFKCVDSFFFQEFDGEWKVKMVPGPNGEPETLLSYSVDVRPKGPVPVGALEWRIREDVPTNLRAVKRAAIESGREGVMAFRGSQGVGFKKALKERAGSLVPLGLLNDFWDRDETMAAYLTE